MQSTQFCEVASFSSTANAYRVVKLLIRDVLQNQSSYAFDAVRLFINYYKTLESADERMQTWALYRPSKQAMQEGVV